MKLHPFITPWQRYLLCAGLFLLTGQRLVAESAIEFFTNVGGKLLQSQLGVNLSRIQIYPANEYTPAVHRLLQVTANLYDSTTNRTDTTYPYLPSVFRPVFTNDGVSVFIAGYVEETGTDFLNHPVRDLSNESDRDALGPDDAVYSPKHYDLLCS